jgi:hypothetical protein
MTISYNQHLMILSVRRLTTLLCVGLRFLVRACPLTITGIVRLFFVSGFVEIGVTKIRFVDNFRHLAFTFHTSTSDSIGTAVILSRL